MTRTQELLKYAVPSRVESTIVPTNTKVSSVSKFNDLVWDRTEFIPSRINAQFHKINWANCYGGYWQDYYSIIVSFMEFAYACLFDPIADEKSYDSATVKQSIYNLANFLGYLQSRRIYCFNELTHNDFYEYVRWLLNEEDGGSGGKPKNSLESVGRRIRSLQFYYRYSKRVSQPLRINPLHGESVFKYLNKKPSPSWENKTPLIPKEIWDPYLCAALHYVEIYASDILKAQSLVEDLRINTLPERTKNKKCSSSFGKFVVQPRLGKLGGFSINPETGKPWRTHWKSVGDWKTNLNALHDACLVVIGCISAMRESELALIEVDGWTQESSLDGMCQIYSITSRVVKGDKDKRTAWTVNEIVYRACEIMKQLTSYVRAETSYKHLFIMGWNRGVASPVGAYNVSRLDTKQGKRSILPVSHGDLLGGLNRFAKHIQTEFGEQYQLPCVDGEPWRFTTRQLRRSLAARLAREPFGSLAGMLHYKHIKVTTFLGYAGSDPLWINDLHDEEIAANEEFLEHIWEDLQESALAGGKGQELIRDFKGTAGEIKKGALQYFIESNRANLHVGLLNYCLFQRDAALCLMSEKENRKDAPIMNACHPDRCANSCISTVHLPQWEIQVRDAQAMLNHKKVSIPQRIALGRDMEKALRIVNQLKNMV